MNLDDRKRLKKCHVLLVTDIQFFEIQDYLYQYGILTSDELGEIEATPLRSEKVRNLIRLLRKKEGIFHLFCEALRKCGYDYIAESLENADVSDIADEEVQDCTDATREEKMEALLNSVAGIQIKLQKDIEEVLQIRKAETGSRAHPHSAPIAPDGLDVADGTDVRMRRFVDNCLVEFVKRRRKTFSEIERIACHLGVETVRQFIGALERDGGSDGAVVATASPDSSSVDSVMKTMRRVVKEMVDTHGCIVGQCIEAVHMSEIDGIGEIDLVAEGLFEDDRNVNWGRIVTWYVFWCSLISTCSSVPGKGSNAQRCGKTPDGRMKETFGEFIGFYLAKRYFLWISGAGGWESFVEKFNK